MQNIKLISAVGFGALASLWLFAGVVAQPEDRPKAIPDTVFLAIPSQPVIAVEEVVPIDDGVVVAAGAHLKAPVACRPVRRYRTVGWWQRGPVRRLVSWPFRGRCYRR